jgi:hypothetical protein
MEDRQLNQVWIGAPHPQNFEILKSIEQIQESKEGKELGWASNTPARGPLFGPNVLPIFYHIFPSTVQVLHVVSW